MPSPRLASARRAAWLVALLAASPSQAQLGLGLGGGPSADPVGLALQGFESLEVRRADVDLDLRAIYDDPQVGADAVYTVFNPAPEAVEARVLVIQGSSPRHVSPAPQADLDGAALAPPERATVDWGLMWNLVRHVPAPAGYAAREYAQHPGDPVAFRVRVPPGEHRLRVRQRVWSLDLLDVQRLFGQFQVQYGLSPSRRWTGLRELSLRVRVPAGWPAASSPPLARSGDELTGRWSAAPDAVLSLSVHVPRRSLGDAKALPWVLLVAGLAGALAAAVAVGRRLALAARPWTPALLGIPVAFFAPGLLYHLGDRAAAAIIAHRMGHPPHTDILSTFVDLVVMGAAGVAAVFAYILASLLAHRAAARRIGASAPLG